MAAVLWKRLGALGLLSKACLAMPSLSWARKGNLHWHLEQLIPSFFFHLGVCRAASCPFFPQSCFIQCFFAISHIGCVWHGAAQASSHGGALQSPCHGCSIPHPVFNYLRGAYRLLNCSVAFWKGKNNKKCLLGKVNLSSFFFSFYYFLDFSLFPVCRMEGFFQCCLPTLQVLLYGSNFCWHWVAVVESGKVEKKSLFRGKHKGFAFRLQFLFRKGEKQTSI